MMIYSNTKVKIYSVDRDTDFVNIVAGVLHRDTLALYLFIKALKKARSRYHTETIMYAGYVDDIVLLANTPTQTKSLL